jgi:hypothetical protein
MDERDAAQAAELVRALRDQLHEMTHELVRLERQGVIGTSSRASAIRCEAALPKLVAAVNVDRKSTTKIAILYAIGNVNVCIRRQVWYQRIQEVSQVASAPTSFVIWRSR